jgi:nuclear GTP-binding protein
VNGGDARTKATIKVLNMYKGGKAIRSKDGTIVGGDLLMKTRSGGKEIDAATGRIQPDRRWFGNTRTVGATELDRFREEMRVKAADPYSVILRRKKLPMGLLVESNKMLDGSKAKLLEVTHTCLLSCVLCELFYCVYVSRLRPYLIAFL